MKSLKIYKEYTDYDLVKECINGNNECFSELVTRYKNLVYSTVHYFEKEPENASDITQEVFIRVYRSLDKYNPQFKFSTWIVRITRNLCLDEIRKKKVILLPIEEYVEVCRGEETPEAKYINREKSMQIKQAIDGLPEKYKTVVVLYHKMGLSYKDMAEKLGEPMSKIKNRMFKARTLLREKLKGIEAAC